MNNIKSDSIPNHHHFKIFKPHGFLSQFVPERMKKKVIK